VVILPETGDYYLKVKAWNHPGAGGENYPYSLHIFEDSTPPVISVTAPGSVWPTNLTFPFSVDGRDGSTRIMQMDFFWHPADWQGGTWTLIGSDYTGNDGWGVQVDPTKLGELKNSALYVEAKDAAGNVSGEIRITAQVDAIPPVVNINPLPGSMDTTAFQVTFSGSDDTQLQSLILESRANGGGWGGNGTIYGAGQFTEWYVGTPGTAVEFQAVAKDAAGNSNTAGATTQISGTCLQDSYESKDNTSSGATSLGIGVAQEHNFCQNDEDWFTFNAEAGKGYYITLGSLGGGAAFNLDVLAADGTTRLANSFSSDLGQPTALVWKPAATGKVYVKVTPVVPELAGTAVRYSIIINTPIFYYFPFVGK